MTSLEAVLRAAGVDPEEFCIGETVSGDKVIIGYWWKLNELQTVLPGVYRKRKDLFRRVEDILRRLDYDCRFEDELLRCDNCYKYCELQPGYYGDLETPSVDENGVLCPDCTREFPAEYLESVQDDPDRANHLLSDSVLQEQGWTKIEGDFEHGLHPGQTDSPQDIYRKVKDSPAVQEKRDYLPWENPISKSCLKLSLPTFLIFVGKED